MKHCPNPDCPFFREHGVAAEYEDRVEKCLDCGTQLTPGPAPAPPKKEKEPPLAEWGAIRTVVRWKEEEEKEH